MNAQFDLFLSHNSKDKAMVRQLAEALQRRGLRVWLDEWELTPGRPSPIRAQACADKRHRVARQFHPDPDTS